MTRRGPRCSSGKRWTREEDDELRRLAPYLTYNQLGRILPGRSNKAVRARLIVLGLYAATARNVGGYMLQDVAAILGMPLGTVTDWVRFGKLPCSRAASFKTQHARGGGVKIVFDVDLDTFITEYPFLFSLATFPEGPHKATLIMARPQDWLTLRQAARLLGLSRHPLTEAVEAGTLTCRRWGPQLFFHRRDIERFRHDRARRMMQNPGYARRWGRRKELAS